MFVVLKYIPDSCLKCVKKSDYPDIIVQEFLLRIVIAEDIT